VELAAFPQEARKRMELDLLEQGQRCFAILVRKLFQPSLYMVAGNDRLTPAGEEGLKSLVFFRGGHQLWIRIQKIMNYSPCREGAAVASCGKLLK